MKVAFFLGGLRRGGAESLVYDICRKRDEAPFDLCCLYRKDDDFSEEFKATGAELVQVPRTGSMFRYMRDLRKAAKAHGVDILHAQTASNALVSILAFLFTRVKVVTTFHGFSFSNAPAWYRKLVYGGSRRIVCVSGYEKQYYVDKWKLPVDNKLRVVYNGIDFTKLDHSQPDPARPGRSRWTGIPSTWSWWAVSSKGGRSCSSAGPFSGSLRRTCRSTCIS